MTALKIHHAGLYTTIQDTGRIGFRRFGIPVSGALDHPSMTLANALLGNDADCATLECRFLGPHISALDGDIMVAIVGATINAVHIRGAEHHPVLANRSVRLAAGDQLQVGALRDSSTAYIAVTGGIDVPSVLGSSSTYAKAEFGGYEGRALADGDVIPVTGGSVAGPTMLTDPPALASADPIRVVLGPQQDYFSEQSLSRFTGQEWKVSQQADRMGIRLDGDRLDHLLGYNIVSDGTTGGAIQVPGNGQPIILLADAQTSGGYPKIATVVSADLNRIGRMAPGQTLRFAAITAEAAIETARQAQATLEAQIAGIGPYRTVGEIDIDALQNENLISVNTEYD